MIVIENYDIIERDRLQIIKLHSKYNPSRSSCNDSYSLGIHELSHEDFLIIKPFVEKVSMIVDMYVEYCCISLFKTGDYMEEHVDSKRTTTKYSSVSYLNDDFEGGETVITDNLIVNPQVGKTIYFDGCNLPHGVNQIKKGLRYTLSMWYTDSNNNLDHEYYRHLAYENLCRDS